MKTIIERIDAKEKGFIRYFTGKPCKNNHVAERFVSDGKCIECNRIKMQKYWASYPDAVEKRNEKNRKIRTEKPDLYEKYQEQKRIKWHSDKEYRDKQLQIMSIKNAERYKNNLEFAEKIKKQSREWPNINRAAYRNKMARRRARLNQAMPSWVNKNLILEVFKTCPKGYHVDHIVPLNGKNVCGLHVHWNLQHLPASKNLSKGNKHLAEF
jgi:hypothetical protein